MRIIFLVVHVYLKKNNLVHYEKFRIDQKSNNNNNNINLDDSNYFPNEMSELKQQQTYLILDNALCII